MRANYSGDKRRRELAAKQKKEAKAIKTAERKALKERYPDGVPPDANSEDPDPGQESDQGR